MKIIITVKKEKKNVYVVQKYTKFSQIYVFFLLKFFILIYNHMDILI